MSGAKKQPDQTLPLARNKGGRPKGTTKLQPDEATLKALQGLGNIQCTTKEGAAFFSVSEPTFLKFLTDNPQARAAFDEGKGKGRISLRRHQFRLAESNAAMAIFLGKNYLDQTDRVEQRVEHSGEIEVTDARERLARILAGHSAAGDVGKGAGKPH